jgi:hypothetical protein
VSFSFTESQVNQLNSWKRVLDTERVTNWYEAVKRASSQFNVVLTDAGFGQGRSLDSNQIERLFEAMRRLSHNRALNKRLYELNGLEEFNKRLRTLLFGPEPIHKRIDQFKNLKGVKEMTISQFLCLKDPTNYPYVSSETYDMLGLERHQEEVAKTQALSEHSIQDPREYHGTTIRYLRDWVVFRSVKKLLELEGYPLVNMMLWEAFEEGGSAERRTPSAIRGEKRLYEPLARALLTRNTGKENSWTKVTAESDRSGQWSRPDLTCVEVSWFDYLPQKFVEVTSYEAKKQDSYNVSSVYEAAAHQRFAHKTYLVVEVENSDEELASDVESEAARLGVGIMKTWWKDPAEHELAVEEIMEPAMKTPDPAELNRMVRDFFEDDEKGLSKYRHAIGK